MDDKKLSVVQEIKDKAKSVVNKLLGGSRGTLTGKMPTAGNAVKEYSKFNYRIIGLLWA